MAPSQVLSSGSMAPTHQLAIKHIFEGLTEREKLYAHHLSRAAWHGSRIVMQQTSPESVDIFDFILDVHRSCNGKWASLIDRCDITSTELQAFLEYAALFLSNLGNYYREGDRKFVPDLSVDKVRAIASISSTAKSLLEKIIDPLLTVPPFSLGFPSANTQSSYYPGDQQITREEINAVSRIIESNSIEPENTRIRKTISNGGLVFEVLQASAEHRSTAKEFKMDSLDAIVRVVTGDYAEQMAEICEALSEAKKFAANDYQTRVLRHYIESFRTGNMEPYRESQKAWVGDKSPRVENVIGFVEPYRDPYGVRGEWEAFICISDPNETKVLKQFVDRSATFVRLLPWAVSGENGGKGPFEKSSFEVPDFTSLHALAFCSSVVWEGVNLPNYNDIRETDGFKNIIIANRMSANNNPANLCRYVPEVEKERFRECIHCVRFVCTAIHELLGHGTGKLLKETATGVYNFDRANPPINPVDKKPVDSWYLPGQTWTGVFEDIAPSVEECRATLVAQYLVDNKELLGIFGYTKSAAVTADDILHHTYIELGVAGLRALGHYNANEKKWGDAHSRGNFAILKHVLLDGNGVLTVKHDTTSQDLTVHIDRSKIVSDGKPALGRLLCRLHVWRCIADAKSCRDLYETLTSVSDEYEEWRQTVCAKREPLWKFVQANSILNGERVDLKVYDESNEGIIQSWVERNV